ncbi:MAG: cell division septation protein DedD [Methylophagaceae bacterium]|jgi:cell division septation protein DedD
MTTIQLQRIIGVALLFSVIIGIAMLLIRSADDGVAIDNTEQISNLGFDSQIAEITEPYVEEATINLEPVKQSPDELIPEQAMVESKTIPEPVVAEPLPDKIVQADISAQKWVIQLASFSVKANADALSLQIDKMGYKSVIENSNGVSGKVYRVRLEPMADKRKAQAIANDLSKTLTLSTQVLQE